MKKIVQTLNACVQPLRRDPEIALDVRRELTGHLEERIAEGMSEEEALKHFGDPGEIGSGLLRANFRRMKLRARLRLILMILAIPAVLATLYWAINFRFWAGLANYRKIVLNETSLTLFEPLFRLSAHVEPTLSPENELIVNGDRSRQDSAELNAEANAQYAIREAYPENKIYYAHSILYVLMCSKNKAFKIAELEKARAFEQDNGFYDILLAAILLDGAIEIDYPDQKTLPPSITVLDRSQLDRAMAFFQEGLTKPYLRSYVGEMTEERITRLNLSGDFFSEMQRMLYNEIIILPQLNHYRELSRILPVYGEILIEEGNFSRGEFFLEAWKPFVRKIAADDVSLIGFLIDGSIINNQKIFARRPIPETRLKEIEQALVPIGKIKPANNRTLAGTYSIPPGAGMLSCMLLPGLNVEPSDAELEPERRLNYVLADGVMLLLLNLVGLAVLIGYTVALLLLFWRGQTGFLLTFTRRDYFRIALWGVVVPLAVFFGVTEFTPLGGRDMGIDSFGGVLRLAGEAIIFVFLAPMPFLILWSRACRRRGRELGFDKLPRAVSYCNMFAGWTVLLVIFTALIRPGLYVAERHWIDKDQLIFRAKASTLAEEQLIQKIRKELLDAIPK